MSNANDTFNIDDATAVLGNGGAAEKRPFLKPEVPDGQQEVRHVAVIDNLRRVDGMSGRWFYLDHTIPGMESPEGGEWLSTWGLCPDQAKGAKKMPPERAKALDYNKVKIAAGAAAGYNESQALALVKGERFNELFSFGEYTTPLVGRKIVVVSHLHMKYEKNGTVTRGAWLSFEPYLNGQEQYQFVAPLPTPKVKPAAPALPMRSARPSFEVAASKAGFEVHPQDPDFWHDGEQVLSIAELKAKLGY